MESRKIKESKYIKGIAWFSLVHAVITHAELFFRQWSEVIFVLASMGLIGAIFLIKREYWGLIILAVYYFPQMVVIFAQDFYINFAVGIKIQFFLHLPEVKLGINFVAIVIFVLCLELMWANRNSATDEAETEEAKIETTNPSENELPKENPKDPTTSP